MKVAIMYLIMGVLFTFLAFRSTDDTIWNPLTIVLLLVAALDFLVAIQFFKKALQRRSKK